MYHFYIWMAYSSTPLVHDWCPLEYEQEPGWLQAPPNAAPTRLLPKPRAPPRSIFRAPMIMVRSSICQFSIAKASSSTSLVEQDELSLERLFGTLGLVA